MIPLTGGFTSEQLLAELGVAGPVSIGEDAAVLRLAGRVGLSINSEHLPGCHLARAGGNAVNAFTAMGSPVAPGTYRYVQEPGITFGSPSPTVWAFDAGTFPATSVVTIDLYGSQDAAGGQYGVNSGQGGSAIKADYASYTLTVNRKAGGSSRAGGGAGGKGGTGGQGGPATGTVVEGPAYDGSNYIWTTDSGPDLSTQSVSWAGVSKYGNDYDGFPTTVTGNDGSSYARGALQSSNTTGNPTIGFRTVSKYAVTRTTTGSGAPGGAGGLGGNGGRGEGFDGAAAAGAASAAGTAGAGDAGAGGAGGQGGTGGVRGATGGTGITASTGVTGGGGPGFAGGVGTVGGPSGFYFYKNGLGNVTFTNAGTVVGRIG